MPKRAAKAKVPVMGKCRPKSIPGDVMNLLALFAMSLSSCGLIPSPADNPEVTTEAKIIYSTFLTDAARFGVQPELKGLTVQLADMPQGVAGSCTADRTVTIATGYWNMVGGYGKELVLFHELGHCTLGQGHRPGSIMSAVLMSQNYYAARREEYKQELLKNRLVSATPFESVDYYDSRFP
jgi:hypothetical protein